MRNNSLVKTGSLMQTTSFYYFQIGPVRQDDVPSDTAHASNYAKKKRVTKFLPSPPFDLKLLPQIRDSGEKFSQARYEISSVNERALYVFCLKTRHTFYRNFHRKKKKKTKKLSSSN